MSEHLNLFLLIDRTGSMARHWSQTIATINEFANGLAGKSVTFNVAFFDKDAYSPFSTTTLATTKPILQIKYNKAPSWTPLSEHDETIKPRGMTPLHDAICEYAASVKASGLKKTDLVQFVIMTDGDENCSSNHNMEDTKKILAKFEKKGWSVLFLGANLEAFSGGNKVVADLGKLGMYNPTKWSETATVMASSTMRYMSSKDVTASAFTDEERGSMS